MPLEPDAQRIVDQIAAMGTAGETADMDVDAGRQGLAGLMLMGSGGPHEVAQVANITAPGPAGSIPLRVYTPAGDTPFPLIVFFHGGGWTLGSIDTHDAVARQLANAAGAVLVSVEYRLAPEHRFPAAADDALAALTWAHANASSIGADPTRVAVAGDSAGGNLAAVTCIRARDEGRPPIRFQLLVYPVTDSRMATPSLVENASGYILTKKSMVSFWDNYMGPDGDRTNPHASPMHAADLARLPPALIITAGFDPLRDEGAAYGARLRDAGVDATVSNYEGMVHVFFGLPALFSASDRAMKEAGEAMRVALA